MSMSDTIADMFARIRNGQMSRLIAVDVPYSKMKQSILDVMIEEGYVDSYSVSEVRPNIKNMEVKLRYSKNGKPVICELKRSSKPGKRAYSSIKDLAPHFNGMGIYILSTSKGVVSDKKARELGVGGEVICKIF